MVRPGFVLDVDDRTPPVLVASGDTFRLERLPVGARVVYPADSLPSVHTGDAIAAALDHPTGSDPLSARLRPGMRLTITFDDNTVPVPGMSAPDLRASIIEAVLTRAAAAGVDDVALIAAIGLNRRQTPAELRTLVGERVFRSFHADGLLSNHDAEDPEELAEVGAVGELTVAVNRRVVESDLVVHVHLVTTPTGGGATAVLNGLGAASTLAGLGAHGADPAVAAEAAELLATRLPLFSVEAVLDADVFPEPLSFLAKREWEWSVKDQARWFGLRRGTAAVTSATLRRRLLGRLTAPWHPVGIFGGEPVAAGVAGAELALTQQRVEVAGQADVGIVGVPGRTPFSVDCPTNPVLAAWTGSGRRLRRPHRHAARPRGWRADRLPPPRQRVLAAVPPLVRGLLRRGAERHHRPGADQCRLREEVRHRPLVRAPLPHQPRLPRVASGAPLVRDRTRHPRCG